MWFNIVAKGVLLLNRTSYLSIPENTQEKIMGNRLMRMYELSLASLTCVAQGLQRCWFSHTLTSRLAQQHDTPPPYSWSVRRSPEHYSGEIHTSKNWGTNHKFPVVTRQFRAGCSHLLEEPLPRFWARPIADLTLAKRHDWSSSQSPSVIAFKEDPGQLVKSSERPITDHTSKVPSGPGGRGSFPAGGGGLHAWGRRYSEEQEGGVDQGRG